MPNESTAEDFIQIKRMIGNLKSSDIASDLTALMELIHKHHPNGTPLLEDIKKQSDGCFQYKLPDALAEFQQLLSKKYNDRKMESAIFMRVLMEFIPDFRSAVNYINGE